MEKTEEKVVEGKPKKKNNIAAGLILSFLIAVAGAALWGLLYYYGIFAAIVSYITAFGMIAVYKCFVKKNSPLPWIWSAFWILALTVVSAILTLLFTLMIEFNVGMGDAVTLLRAVWSQVSSAFFKDLTLGIVFAALGLGCCFAVYRRNEIIRERAEKIVADKIVNEQKTKEQESVIEQPKEIAPIVKEVPVKEVLAVEKKTEKKVAPVEEKPKEKVKDVVLKEQPKKATVKEQPKQEVKGVEKKVVAKRTPAPKAELVNAETKKSIKKETVKKVDGEGKANANNLLNRMRNGE